MTRAHPKREISVLNASPDVQTAAASEIRARIATMPKALGPPSISTARLGEIAHTVLVEVAGGNFSEVGRWENMKSDKKHCVAFRISAVAVESMQSHPGKVRGTIMDALPASLAPLIELSLSMNLDGDVAVWFLTNNQ